MKTYRDHYLECRKRNRINGTLYNSLYDLTVDTTMLGDLPIDLITKIHEQMCAKIDRHDGCRVSPRHALRVDSWRDIDEIYELIEHIMPTIESEIFGCPARVEFVHLYRNVPLDNQPDNGWDDSSYESSWKWHYDDCPREFLKMLINLNTVTVDNGCFKFLLDDKGNAQTLPSYRIAPGFKARSQVYPSSRIPAEVIYSKISEGWSVVDFTGPPGSYAVCTPNIYHRASSPKIGTEPRDVMFLFVRPSLQAFDKYTSKSPDWGGSLDKNVKVYSLD